MAGMETPKEVTIRINVKTNIEEPTLHVPRYTELGMEEIQKKVKEIYDRAVLHASQHLREHVHIHCTKPTSDEPKKPEPKTIEMNRISAMTRAEIDASIARMYCTLYGMIVVERNTLHANEVRQLVNQKLSEPQRFGSDMVGHSYLEKACDAEHVIGSTDAAKSVLKMIGIKHRDYIGKRKQLSPFGQLYQE